MRIKLRLEPYDPDARDADNDGIVQEGTAWERPAGAKLLDDLGREIKRGLTSPYRNTTWQLVDKDGNKLDYVPSYGSDADFNPKEAKPTLEKLGYRSIEAMGLPTVKDLALPSTKPQQDEALSVERQSVPSSPFDILDNIGPTSSAEGKLWNLVNGDDYQTFTRDGFYYIQNGDLDGLLNMAVELYGPEMEDDEQITLNDVLAVFRDKRDEARYPFRSESEIRVWRSGTVEDTSELVSFTTDRSEAEEFGDVPLEYIVPVDAIYSEGHDSYVSELLVDQSMARLVSGEDSRPEPADEASRILGKPDVSLTPTQERSIEEISKLFDLMRALDSDRSRETFIYQYGGSESGFVDPNLDDVDTISLRKHKNKLVAGLLPAQIYDRDGAAYDVRNDYISIEDNHILIEGDIFDASGSRVGSFARRIRLDANDKLVAHHTVLSIRDEQQNKGIGSAFNHELEKMYRALGVDRIEVDASSSIQEIDGVPVIRQRGVSFWPRQGFDWQNSVDRDDTVDLFERLIPDGAVDGSAIPNPSRVYVVGLSDGAPPNGPDRQALAYFSSVDEWDSFVRSYVASRDVPFDDPNRPVAGDLMRWAGADDWVAKRSSGLIPTYTRQLERSDATSTENADAINQIVEKTVTRSVPLSENQIRSLEEVSPLFENFLRSGETLRESLDFSYVEANLADDEDVQLDEAQRFGLRIIGLFEGSAISRDGTLIKIEPRDAYSVFSSPSNSFVVTGVLVNKDGKTIGSFNRALRLKPDRDGKPVIYVEHNELAIDPDSQGKGIGSSFNSQMESIYQKLGVSYIELNGVSGGSYDDQYIGATHWPRSGFDWATDFSKDEHIRILDELVIFDDNDGTYAPSGIAYVEGLSSGKRPIGPDRRTVAYFSSVEEWENFVELLEQSRGESLSDDNRVVAGDLVRWDGADDWFAGGETSFDYIKKLKES